MLTTPKRNSLNNPNQRSTTLLSLDLHVSVNEALREYHATRTKDVSAPRFCARIPGTVFGVSFLAVIHDDGAADMELQRQPLGGLQSGEQNVATNDTRPPTETTEIELERESQLTPFAWTISICCSRRSSLHNVSVLRLVRSSTTSESSDRKLPPFAVARFRGDLRFDDRNWQFDSKGQGLALPP